MVPVEPVVSLSEIRYRESRRVESSLETERVR